MPWPEHIPQHSKLKACFRACRGVDLGHRTLLLLVDQWRMEETHSSGKNSRGRLPAEIWHMA
jgi:hypothetical protein